MVKCFLCRRKSLILGDYFYIINMRYIIGLLLLTGICSCSRYQAMEANRKGLNSIMHNQYSVALTELNQAIHLYPDFLPAYYNRAIVLANQQRPQEALKDLNYVIAHAPKYAAAYYNRGIVYENLGKATQAIQDYSRAINLDPTLLNAYHYRGIVRFNMQDLDGALADYDKALSLGLQSSALYFNRGVILHKQGRLGEAISSYTEAIRIDPSNGKSYYNRAISKLVIDNYKEALQDLEIARNLGYTKATEVISKYKKEDKH